MRDPYRRRVCAKVRETKRRSYRLGERWNGGEEKNLRENIWKEREGEIAKGKIEGKQKEIWRGKSD